MYWRRIRQAAVLALAIGGDRRRTGAGVDPGPAQARRPLRRQRPGDDAAVQRIHRTARQAPGAAGDLPPLGQQPQPGLRTLARNRHPTGAGDLDDGRSEPGRADHPRADRPRCRRRLPAAAQRLLRQTRIARLHPAAGRAQPLPQRLVGDQLRRHPEGRRTHGLLVQSRPSAASPRSSAAARPWKGSTRPWPKSACRRSTAPRDPIRPNCWRRR